MQFLEIVCLNNINNKLINFFIIFETMFLCNLDDLVTLFKGNASLPILPPLLIDGLRLPKPGLLSGKSFGSSELDNVSLGILAKRSPTVGPLVVLDLNPPNFGLDVVEPKPLVLCSVLGLNRLENLLLLLFLRLRSVSIPLEA